MEEAGKGPYLILMNHSSFIDLKIAYKIFYPHAFCTVSTLDSFVGKRWLMRQIGCIPTQKYVTDIKLITDMLHTLHKKKTSVLMYPEAGYSFDGTATALPRKLGTLLKKLNVPVLTVITDGAFLREPLYNCLQKRKVKVSAHLHCLLTKEDIAKKSVQELDDILDNAFSFDNFKKQLESKTIVDEPFRADGLNRILYRCPSCNAESQMEGSGTTLTCKCCNKTYEMDVYGQLNAKNGETEFSHIPDWYRWERDCVREELLANSYNQSLEVDIGVLVNHKALYMIGSGTLTHNRDGFHLVGCDGKLDYTQSPTASFSLNADYFWYEIGDVISIGDKNRLFYCFPKNPDVVTKARLAHEELYKIIKNKTINA